MCIKYEVRDPLTIFQLNPREEEINDFTTNFDAFDIQDDFSWFDHGYFFKMGTATSSCEGLGFCDRLSDRFHSISSKKIGIWTL